MTCGVCGEPEPVGQHRITASEAERYPPELCPKCSGAEGDRDAYPQCVIGERAHYRCGCGVRWTTVLVGPR